MDDERLVELLGRAAAVEFALGSIIKHLPGDARKAVQVRPAAFPRTERCRINLAGMSPMQRKAFLRSRESRPVERRKGTIYGSTG
jgi:hypothetical protein